MLARMERSEYTSHGFRSSLSNWAAEQTDFPPHVVEAALAHTIPSAVKAACRHTDLFDRRLLCWLKTFGGERSSSVGVSFQCRNSGKQWTR
jgi:hypothetical protein